MKKLTTLVIDISCKVENIPKLQEKLFELIKENSEDFTVNFGIIVDPENEEEINLDIETITNFLEGKGFNKRTDKTENNYFSRETIDLKNILKDTKPRILN